MFTQMKDRIFGNKEPVNYEVFDKFVKATEDNVSELTLLAEQLAHEEASSRRKTRIVSAVAVISRLFLTSPKVTDNMITCMLGELGEVVNADRVCIFENSNTNGLISTLRFEWVNANVVTHIDEEPFQLKFDEFGLGRWVEVFKQNEIIIGDVDAFEGSEQRFLTQNNTDSVLLVPITVDREWTGLLGLESCKGQRYWTGQEQDALKMCSDIFGAAIYAERTTIALKAKIDECIMVNEELEHTAEKVEKAKQKYKSLFTNSIAGICRINYKTFEVVEINQRGAELLGYRSWKDVKGRDVREAFVDKEMFDVILKDLLRDKEVKNAEVQVATNNEKTIWLKLSCKIVRDSMEADSIFISVTMEKEAKKALDILTDAINSQKLGDILVQKGYVTDDQITEALREQKK